jgi:hypothetical protein
VQGEAEDADTHLELGHAIEKRVRELGAAPDVVVVWTADMEKRHASAGWSAG